MGLEIARIMKKLTLDSMELFKWTQHLGSLEGTAINIWATNLMWKSINCWSDLNEVSRCNMALKVKICKEIGTFHFKICSPVYGLINYEIIVIENINLILEFLQN